ncbi:MAG: hypothetical protein DHS20C18_46060 [Saprospiraceae bacterium]|nr:MAG: hypothetical protein DHS20C18_46060 [Saprospiraceae bacterium]
MNSTPKFAIVTMLMVIAASLQAQVSVGLKSGLNWANVSTTEALGSITPDFKSLDEFNFGIVAEVGITDYFAVQPELNFVKKGFALNEGLDAELFGVNIPLGVMAESRFNYVEVPVLAKLKVGSDRVKAYAVAGPTFGYATSGKIDTKAKVLVEIPLGSIPINLDNINYERFEVGAVVGAGVSIDTGFGQLFADARYSHGFTELYDIPLVNEKVKNQGFGINLGFMVPIN